MSVKEQFKNLFRHNHASVTAASGTTGPIRVNEWTRVRVADPSGHGLNVPSLHDSTITNTNNNNNNSKIYANTLSLHNHPQLHHSTCNINNRINYSNAAPFARNQSETNGNSTNVSANTIDNSSHFQQIINERKCKY